VLFRAVFCCLSSGISPRASIFYVFSGPRWTCQLPGGDRDDLPLWSMRVYTSGPVFLVRPRCPCWSLAAAVSFPTISERPRVELGVRPSGCLTVQRDGFHRRLFFLALPAGRGTGPLVRPQISILGPRSASTRSFSRRAAGGRVAGGRIREWAASYPGWWTNMGERPQPLPPECAPLALRRASEIDMTGRPRLEACAGACRRRADRRRSLGPVFPAAPRRLRRDRGPGARGG